MSRRILGLDLGTKTGWCRSVGDLYEWGTWDLSEREARLRPYVLLERLYRVFHQPVRPDLVVMEQVQFVVSFAQITLWSGLAAAVRIACEREIVQLVEVPTGTLKRFATGKGNADKMLMMMAAVTQLEDDIEIVTDMTSDEADAFHLVRYGEDAA